MKTKKDLRQIGFFQFVRIIFSAVGFELSILSKTFFSRLKLWRQRLHVPKHEFDSSLDLNEDAYATMTRKQQLEYDKDLYLRRQKAHVKDMESTSKNNKP